MKGNHQVVGEGMWHFSCFSAVCVDETMYSVELGMSINGKSFFSIGKVRNMLAFALKFCN